MKDYKVKQLIFNKTVKTDDHLSQIKHTVLEMNDEELIMYGRQYFLEDTEVVFPAKSYAVAVIYATLIAQYFDEDFYEVLADEDLFVGTDRFFRPYNEKKTVYNQIIEFLKSKNLFDFEKSNISQVLKTVEYFKTEFLWEERC